MVVSEIESEILAENQGDEKVLVHCSPKWLVLFVTTLKIVPQEKLTSYVIGKNCELNLLTEGTATPVMAKMPKEDFLAVVAVLKERIPEKGNPAG